MTIAMVERNKEEVDDDDEEDQSAWVEVLIGNWSVWVDRRAKVLIGKGRTKKLTKDWWEGLTCWVLTTHLVEQNHHTILTIVTALSYF